MSGRVTHPDCIHAAFASSSHCCTFDNQKDPKSKSSITEFRLITAPSFNFFHKQPPSRSHHPILTINLFSPYFQKPFLYAECSTNNISRLASISPINMAALSAKPGPTRTPKTPKRVRFAGEDRERTKIIRYQEAKRRDARCISRVDVSYHFPIKSVLFLAAFVRTMNIIWRLENIIW